MTPTARTLMALRAMGYTVAVVERWNPHARIRQDLFGFGDIIGIGDGYAGCFMVQACAGASHAARKAKMIAEPLLREWLRFGNRACVMSWSKRGARGKRKLWEVRRERITMADLPAAAGAGGEE